MTYTNSLPNLEHALQALTALPEAALDLLQPITSEEAYDTALEAIDRLSLTLANDSERRLGPVYATLISHIVAYEEKAYPIEPVAANVMLNFLIEQKGIRQSTLANALDIDQSNVSRLISGKKVFTADLINKLSQIFKVPGTVFLA